MDGTIRTKSFVGDRDAFFRTFWHAGYWVRVPILLAVLAPLAFLIAGPAWFATWSGFALVILFFVGVRYVYLRRAIYSKANAAFYDAPRTWEITEEGVYARVSDGAEVRSPWFYYARALRGRGGTFLRRKEGTASYVPDDAFESPADLDRFLGILREKGLLRR